MADDVSKSLTVTQFSAEPGLPNDAWPVVTTADGQHWYLSPGTLATCDGVSTDAGGVILWLTTFPAEVVMTTGGADEYFAVRRADFTSTHNRGD